MTKPRVLAEVCVETAADAVAATAGGADRLELCAELPLGGLTPSLDAVHDVLAATRLPVVAMVRSRAGDFHYGSEELVAMDKEAQTLLAMGAAGIVFGAVDADGMPQAEALRRLRAAADRASRGRAELVFHRAFDRVPDPRAALDLLVDCGVDRVLTSGHPDGVARGMDALADLVAYAGARITVMPGGGIRADNLVELVRRTGASEVHFSARPDAAAPTETAAVAAFVGILRAAC